MTASSRRHKIILYNPDAVFFTMPLALLALGSALDSTRYTVCIVDGRLERDPVGAVLAEIDDALCLGVTVLTGMPIRDALRVSRAAKARRPDLPVIWGGWHASLFPTETLADPAIDVTVQGQGEVTFAELVARRRAMSPRFETPIFYYQPYPGSRIADEAVRNGYQLPSSLDAWADFDFVGGSGPWVDSRTYQWVERFKFYNRFAGGPETWPRRLLQTIARWRCRRDWYHVPLEKVLVERLKPGPRLS